MQGSPMRTALQAAATRRPKLYFLLHNEDTSYPEVEPVEMPCATVDSFSSGCLSSVISIVSRVGVTADVGSEAVEF